MMKTNDPFTIEPPAVGRMPSTPKSSNDVRSDGTTNFQSPNWMTIKSKIGPVSQGSKVIKPEKLADLSEEELSMLLAAKWNQTHNRHTKDRDNLWRLVPYIDQETNFSHLLAEARELRSAQEDNGDESKSTANVKTAVVSRSTLNAENNALDSDVSDDLEEEDSKGFDVVLATAHFAKSVDAKVAYKDRLSALAALEKMGVYVDRKLAPAQKRSPRPPIAAGKKICH